MSGNKKILVAAADVKDAGVVCQLLRREFDEVTVSTDPNKAVEDFEQCMPAVLVLAFTSLSKAQEYYQELYRESAPADVHPHKILILCSKTDLAEVYALCRKGHFSSYVLFWPLSYDAIRLQMEVHHALEQVAEMELGKPTISEFSAQIRRISGLESLLELSLSKGDQHIEFTRNTLEQAGEDIGLALEGFARRFSVGEHKELLESCGPVGNSVLNLLESEITRLKTEQVDKHSNMTAAVVQPLTQWVGELKEDLAPGLESMREMQELTKSRPLVLVVDDDEFQHKLMARLLADSKIELMFALSSHEALAAMHKRRPELVLMDIDLPDVSGIETTRRIKSIASFAAVPIVMITGHSQKEMLVESLKAGACDFVVKPYDKVVLLKKFRTLLHME